MTSIEEHKNKIKEHLDEIDDAIEEGIENKPITIGFHCSACAIQFLELYLHLTNKISIGKVVKHDWFKRPQQKQRVEPLIERKLKVKFEKKEDIYNLIYDLEDERTILMYGKPVENQIKRVLEIFISKSGFNTPKRFALEYNLFQFARADRFPQLAVSDLERLKLPVAESEKFRGKYSVACCGDSEILGNFFIILKKIFEGMFEHEKFEL